MEVRENSCVGFEGEDILEEVKGTNSCRQLDEEEMRGEGSDPEWSRGERVLGC